MSHFSVGVLIPPHLTEREGQEAHIEQVLAPYDENLEGPERREPWDDHEIERFEKWANLKVSADLATVLVKMNEWNGGPNGYDSQEDEFYRTTTYNKDSKWDWWQIGGRWTGALHPEYDPEKDPRNIVTCFLCRGTGKRPRDQYWDPDSEAAARMNGCNGCQGEGKHLGWPTGWASFDGDIEPVEQALKAEFSPFALVDCEGEWIERGNMGWWGMASNEKEEAEWDDQVKTILESHRDHLIAVVDCHI